MHQHQTRKSILLARRCDYAINKVPTLIILRTDGLELTLTNQGTGMAENLSSLGTGKLPPFITDELSAAIPMRHRFRGSAISGRGCGGRGAIPHVPLVQIEFRQPLRVPGAPERRLHDR
ncbi:hypothetical protein CEXT_371191 [Caerostris extrusa]|uniref:Uncharacterized protein n=1 Tax=Caerostris extrusa TaxID=172846 RepID=A0AAV4SYR3_CAEEX|nr:hypothetical protein CEXT_371191 [Caerostris extrusa]